MLFISKHLNKIQRGSLEPLDTVYYYYACVSLYKIYKVQVVRTVSLNHGANACTNMNPWYAGRVELLAVAWVKVTSDYPQQER